jgi:hypothetical protein
MGSTAAVVRLGDNVRLAAASRPPATSNQLSLQCQLRAKGADGRPNTRGRSPGSARHSRSGRRDRSSPALPVLRLPHDYRRVCARRRTSRPAGPWRRNQDLIDDHPYPLAAAPARWNISFPVPRPFQPGRASASKASPTSSQPGRRVRQQRPVRIISGYQLSAIFTISGR